MKYIVVLGDGMADEPIAALNGKTPLQAADIPHIDKLAAQGRSGLLDTIPPGMPPGSEIANLSVMGYDVEKVFEGRGVLEAASMGVELEPGDLALRCNLICLEDEKIKNHSAGHIPSDEAAEIIEFLNKKLGNETIRFYPGVSYRHLLVIRGGRKEIRCTPPHDVTGTPFREVLVSSMAAEATATANLINYLINRSRWLLMDHPVNIRRREAGKDPATCIWPWSPGYKPDMPTFKELWGIEKSAVISAVDLIQGIGRLAGMDVIKVEGATGLHDTNYEGKAEATLRALDDHDFVYLHIEASDEAGHEGDAGLKVRTIEYLDYRVVKTLMEKVKDSDDPVAIAVLPDHPTPCALKTHTREPVPFLIHKPGIQADSVVSYDEFSAAAGYYGTIKGADFMRIFLKDQA